MKILVVLGTRPEAIKLAPVINRLSREPGVDVRVCATGQHRELLRRTLSYFGIAPDVDLDLMTSNQGLGDFMSLAVKAIGAVVQDQVPDRLVVQGDTSTVLAGALSAFYADVPVAHVEAGLRSHDLRRPFPEEMNRRATTLLASLHLAPTPAAKENLLREGVDPVSVCVTGNSVIDALFDVRRRMPQEELDRWSTPGRRSVLLTCHRRENFGAPMERIFRTVVAMLDRYEDLEVIFPMHPNPNVRSAVEGTLSVHPRARLVEPLEYPSLVALLSSAHFVITDSGGIQEEAPSLGKPVLVLRDVTERPEAVEAGAVLLVGSDGVGLMEAATNLMEADGVYARMAKSINPYGDGKAADRIVDAILGRPVVEFTPVLRVSQEDHR